MLEGVDGVGPEFGEPGLSCFIESSRKNRTHEGIAGPLDPYEDFIPVKVVAGVSGAVIEVDDGHLEPGWNRFIQDPAGERRSDLEVGGTGSV